MFYFNLMPRESPIRDKTNQDNQTVTSEGFVLLFSGIIMCRINELYVSLTAIILHCNVLNPSNLFSVPVKLTMMDPDLPRVGYDMKIHYSLPLLGTIDNPVSRIFYLGLLIEF